MSFLNFHGIKFKVSRHFAFVLICQSFPNQQLTFTKTRPFCKQKSKPGQFPVFRNENIK